jgi:hypothetical protein
VRRVLPAGYCCRRELRLSTRLCPRRAAWATARAAHCCQAFSGVEHRLLRGLAAHAQHPRYVPRCPEELLHTGLLMRSTGVLLALLRTRQLTPQHRAQYCQHAYRLLRGAAHVLSSGYAPAMPDSCARLLTGTGLCWRLRYCLVLHADVTHGTSAPRLPSVDCCGRLTLKC